MNQPTRVPTPSQPVCRSERVGACRPAWRAAGALVLMMLGLATMTLGACAASTTDWDLDEAAIALPELQRELARSGEKRVVFIDSRPPEEFGVERIPGAVNRLVTDVSNRVASVDPRIDAFDMQVVYGYDEGTASTRALAKRMITAGYGNVRYFAGGLAEWKRSGLRTDQTTMIAPGAPGARGAPASSAAPRPNGSDAGTRDR